MCNDVGETSRCCLFYSATGAIFTLWVGVMLHTQPFFISGIDDPQEAKVSAFGAMGMFLFIIALSILGLKYEEKLKQESVEEGDITTEGYQLAVGDQPVYGTT